MSFDTLNSQLELFTDYGSGKFFLGKVYDNKDPLNLDRIRASVPGLYDPDLGETPWIGPVKFSPFGTGDTWGVYGTPALDSNVLILLQDGDPHYPMYFSVQTKENTEFPSGECWGFQDPLGNKVKFDLSTGEISFTTSTGVSVDVDMSGNVSVVSPGNISANANGSVSVTSPVRIDLNAPVVETSDSLRAGDGASGSITDVAGKVAVFQSGICISIT